MKRIDGFYDLDDYFKRSTRLKNVTLRNLTERRVAKSATAGTSALFWFKYYGVKVLFKGFGGFYNCFSEMISERLCYLLDIPTAKYDLAVFENYLGVITYDFKKPDYTYIDMFDILDKYESYYFEKYSKEINACNSLEDIWCALEFYLKNNSNINKSDIPIFLEKIMLQLTDYFDYQIISGNFDMHSGNIEIGVKNDFSDIIVTPIYDNEDMYKISSDITYRPNNSVEFLVHNKDDEKSIDRYDLLRNYLDVSDSLFYERFVTMLNKLGFNTMNEILSDIEEKIGIEIPIDKNIIINEFNNNLQELKIIAGEYSLKRKIQ